MNKKSTHVARIAESSLFDAAWYVEKYPDVSSASISPAEHYLRYGAQLLRDPGPQFNTRQYLLANKGLDPAQVNPLLHYLESGVAKRSPLQPPSAASAPTLIGYFDKFDDATISGWAVDVTKPGRPVELAISVDEEPVCRIKTGLQRTDVSAAGFNGSAAGFLLNIPTGLFPAGTKMDIAFAGSSLSLKKSPKTKKTAGASVGTSGRYMDAVHQGQTKPTTIIVPVFNAFEAVAECILAVLDYLGSGVELLIIDDASTDGRIVDLLNSCKDVLGVHVQRNELNLGYTRTVNRGMAQCAGRDVVLLNSDTVVTGNWLSSLRYCAYAFGKVATVTALSNNAGAFSIPEPTSEDRLPIDRLQRQSYARAIVQAGTGMEIDVPTGNGFCMYIRRDALDDIGDFDDEKFPRGYGEENEFCMRGLRNGWRHLVSDKAYVFHKRSQSFMGQKQELVAQALRTINAEFPEYKRLISRFKDMEFNMIRQRAKLAVKETTQAAGRKRILFVISTLVGGTPQTNLDLMRAVSIDYECLLLRCDARLVTLSKLVNGELKQVEAHRLRHRIDPITHSSREYDNYVVDILYRFSIDLLHVRHIAWHSLGLLEAANALSVPIVYSVHDFYTVCPTVKLLDQDLKFCAGSCTPGAGECRVELWRQEEIPNLKHDFIRRWRQNQSRSFDAVGAFITTSNFTADLFVSAFPEVPRERFSVIPHGRDFPSFTAIEARPNANEKLRVLVLGNIALAKGAGLITALAANEGGQFVELHFLGNVASELSGVGIQHGSYRRDDVIRRVSEIAPHVGIILSIWPETFCHTLTELWASGIPVLGMDIGSVGERIKATGAGWLIPVDVDADGALSALLDIRSDIAGYEQRIQAVRKWQETEGVSSSSVVMAARYSEIYEQLLKADRRNRTPGALRGMLGS